MLSSYSHVFRTFALFTEVLTCLDSCHYLLVLYELYIDQMFQIISIMLKYYVRQTDGLLTLTIVVNLASLV